MGTLILFSESDLGFCLKPPKKGPSLKQDEPPIAGKPKTSDLPPVAAPCRSAAAVAGQFRPQESANFVPWLQAADGPSSFCLVGPLWFRGPLVVIPDIPNMPIFVILVGEEPSCECTTWPADGVLREIFPVAQVWGSGTPSHRGAALGAAMDAAFLGGFNVQEPTNGMRAAGWGLCLSLGSFFWGSKGNQREPLFWVPFVTHSRVH